MKLWHFHFSLQKKCWNIVRPTVLKSALWIKTAPNTYTFTIALKSFMLLSNWLINFQPTFQYSDRQTAFLSQMKSARVKLYFLVLNLWEGTLYTKSTSSSRTPRTHREIENFSSFVRSSICCGVSGRPETQSIKVLSFVPHTLSLANSSMVPFPSAITLPTRYFGGRPYRPHY